MLSFHEEEFEDIKGVIRIRISKKNRQHNGKNKRYKRINNDLQNELVDRYGISVSQMTDMFHF
jgi:hypothetical protein